MKSSSMISTVGFTRRRSAAIAVTLTVTASLLLTAILPASADSKKTTRLTEEQKIIHLLNRIGFGPRPGDVEKVKRIGIDKYIDQQLHPDRIDDSALQAKLAGLDSLGMTVAQLYQKYPAPQFIARELGLRPGKGQPPNPQAPNATQPGSQDSDEAKADQREQRQKIQAYYAEKGLKPPATLIQELQAQKIIRAVYSERQLQEVMSDFWFNHFNIFWGKGADKWMTTDFEINAIRPHTLGKFQDLLLATAKSPAMLFYLDNFQSSSPNTTVKGNRRKGQDGQLQPRRGAAGRGLDDRRIQERLRQRALRRGQSGDQTEMTPQQQQQRAQVLNQLGKRKPGINENYAREIMELHTLGVDGGYTQKDVQEVARCLTGWTIQAPRQNGSFVFREFMHDDGEKTVLGQKIPAGGGMKDGEKVIEILSRQPSTAKFISTKLVRRFISDNPPQSLIDRVAGVYAKTGGDIREMMRTILTSQEFFAPANHRAKIKSPFELAASSVRALGGQTSGSRPIAQFIGKMGQPLYAYQAPTGYPDRAEQWVNTGALLERLNFGLALGSNRVLGTTVDPKVVAVAASSQDAKQLMDRAIKVLLNGDVSPETRSILEKQLKEGVPVKGELGDLSAKAIRRTDGVDNEDAMMAQDPLKGPGGKGARKDQRAVMDVYGRRGDRQAAASPVDPDVARVIGLVLGSPEFQRR